ncbi:MAG: PilC/PilY family type IV pilus protein, partial [Hyphomicrobiales bacterium]
VGAGAITVTVTDAANHHAYAVVNVGATITPGLGTCPSPPFSSAPMGPNVMIMFDTSGSMSDDEGDGISRFDEAKAAVIATLDANPNVRFGLTRMDGTAWKQDPRPGGLITTRNAMKGGRVLVPCGFKGSFATSAEYIKWYIQTYMTSVDQMRADYGTIHNTNLAETLADIGRYFATVLDGDGHRVGKGPAGFGYYKEGTDYTYYYDKNHDATLEPFQAQSTDDVGNTIDTTSPIQYSCEKSFVIMFTDGLANTDNNWSLVTDVIGDHDPRDCKRAAPTVIRPDITNSGDAEYGTPRWDASYPCDTREDYMKQSVDPAHWEEPGEAHYLDDVAKYLYDQGLRSDIPGVQNLVSYMIGFYADNSLLRSAAEKGGGKYYTASSLSQLTDALQKSMEDIMLKVSSGTAVSTITTSSSTDNYLIRARFLPGNSWRGYLERFTLPYDADDPDYQADWDAGTLLRNRVAANGHTIRKIYTFMSSQSPNKREFMYADPVKSRMKSLWGTSDSETQDMINYLRGDTTYDGGKYKNRAGGLLGDIIYSTPIAVGAPKGWYVDRPGIVDPPEYASYQAFKATNRLRKTMIYVGANDGMLHAFDAGTGQEDWAFIPENVQGKLKQLTVGGCHQYYVDLTPYIADAWFGSDEDDVDTAHGSDWKTILIGGNRFGGEEYFALDVTNPATDQFSALWDVIPFSGKLSSTVPAVGKVKANDGDVDHWVAFVTSGYHAGTDPGSIAALKVKNGHKKSIWLQGDDYTSERTTQAKGSRVAGRTYYSMSSPAALDSDLDGYLDLVYAGDTEGSLWKFYYDYVADGWKKVELFNTGGQAITATPALAFDSEGNLRIYFGTGKYLEESDKADTSRNAFYCLVEHKQYPGNANNGHFTSTTTISKLNLANLTSAVSQAQFDALAQATRTSATTNGWYFELDVPSSYPAERVLERALVVSNTVFITAFVPNQDVCGYGGNARLYEVNYINGVSDPVVLTQLVAGKRYADIGVGIPSEPVYYFDPSTKKPRILIQKSDSSVEDPQPILQERPMRVRSWKDG